MKKLISTIFAFVAIASMTMLTSCGGGRSPQEEADWAIAKYEQEPQKQVSPIFGNYYNLIDDEAQVCYWMYIDKINTENPEKGIFEKKAEANKIVEDYFQTKIAKEKEYLEHRTDIPFEYNKERFSEAEIHIENISEKQVDFGGTFTYIPTYTHRYPHVDAYFKKSDGTPAHNNEFDSRFKCELECIEGDKYSYKFSLANDSGHGYQYNVIDKAEKIELLWVR